ncbi:MAG: hypothetical protein ACE5KO_01125 [Candidatus Bathyarchaeia archaeon]
MTTTPGKAATPQRPRSTFALLLLIVIGLLSVFFVVNGFDFYFRGDTTVSLTYFALGVVGLIFSAVMANRLMGKYTIPLPKVPQTSVHCSECGFKTVRNFQTGDFIPKEFGVCPNCGKSGSYNIEAIFVEDLTPVKRRREEFL